MSPHPFSPEGRRGALEALGSDRLDVLVVGGGITGAGVARDATLRGWSVGLVEKEDFGFGTSGRSSKIVHGGVRYLEYGQVFLVRESARERKVLKRIAPHLVHPIPFLYPVFGSDSLWMIRAGLALFDVLAQSTPEERRRPLSPEEVRERLPGLRDPLKGGVLYLEYITDDARLTMENALSAAEHGARVANHARVSGLLREDGRVVGAEVEDTLTGERIEARARLVVNATGAWAPQVMESADVPVPRRLRPSKGIHLLLDADRLPIHGAAFLKASNGRRGLAMRRLDHVYVGTSDDDYPGSLDEPRATRAEVVELLAMVQDCFPGAGLGLDDVRATWAGVRPLIHQEGKTTRDTSRADEVWTGTPGLVTVAGGKLTTYRPMAHRVLEAAEKALGRAPGPDRTAEVPLPGAAGEGDAPEPERLRAGRRDRLVERGVAPEVVERLTWLYGRQLEALLSLADDDPSWLEPLAPGVPALRGEARMAAEREMAGTLTDFMDRRAALLLFAPGHGLAGAAPAAGILGDVLGWDAERRRREIADYHAFAAGHGVPAE
ncbi:MAG: glycerol-3-phosphate dehydrogenase/oxidase [Gemmatimonadetes bacterium]|nr:glycerol-3-phosphate dehydrogenase/oxidase [Gemmatimonadota bacterium]